MIFDTSFVIDLMNGDRKATSKLNELIKSGEPQLTTVLTVFELYSGLERSNKPVQERNKIINVLGNQIIIPLDGEAAEKAGEIDGNLIKEGRMIEPADSMIAGIASVRREKVLTRNVADFSKVKGLAIETY